jgi:translation initiation factor 2B subunit (eIF-2B alpha/beta/delta family)
MILLFILIGGSAYMVSYREFHGTRKEFGRAMDDVKNKLDKPLVYSCTFMEMVLFNLYTFRILSTSKSAYNRRMSSARQGMRDAHAKMEEYDAEAEKASSRLSASDNVILHSSSSTTAPPSGGRVRSTSDIHEL